MFKSLKRRLSQQNVKDEAGGDGGEAAPKQVTSVPGTPKADVSLPLAKKERRKSSVKREQTISQFKNLGLLSDVSAAKREILFKQKLELCTVRFNYDDDDDNTSEADKLGREIKRNTLLELVDFVNSPGGQASINESTIPDIIAMVEANIFRAFPIRVKDFDPEEDEPALESAWPHLQVVYEFLLRFIVHAEVNSRSCKKSIDQDFCARLILLFDTEDPRERDYLKTILHRIYGKFMPHRGYIRKFIQFVFYQFIYETERHNGISELLEILGSIINGFALPLKKEHEVFLKRALIPMHKPVTYAQYQQQLAYCITQYIEKDISSSIVIIEGLIKFWPWSSSTKQVIFINELEEILELIGAEQIDILKNTLFSCIAKLVGSCHFQVAERALFLWNNETLVNAGCFSKKYCHQTLPLLYGALNKNALGHWNNTVESLSSNVLKMYMEYDADFFENIRNQRLKLELIQITKEKDMLKKWDALDALSAKKL